MSLKKLIDVDLLDYFLTKLKALIPTKTSELTNDSGFITSAPSPSSTTPTMNGNATVGIETAYARGDHVHPTDTSRAAAGDLTTHISNINNPHSVTAAQIGAVPDDRKVNGKALSSDITLSASDVDAVSASNPTLIWTIGADGSAQLRHAGSSGTYTVNFVTKATSSSSSVYLPLINSDGSRNWVPPNQIAGTGSLGITQFMNGLLDLSTAPSTNEGYGTSAYQGWTLANRIKERVPTTRTVNGKALSGDITTGYYLGTAGTSGATFTLTGATRYLVYTTHNSTLTLRVMAHVSGTTVNVMSCAAGSVGSATVTITAPSSGTIKVVTTGGTVGVHCIPVN